MGTARILGLALCTAGLWAAGASARAQELPLGAWTATDKSGAAVLIEETRVGRLDAAGEPTFYRATHEADFGDVIALERYSSQFPLPFTVTDDTLTLDWGADGGEVTYARIDGAPSGLTIAPLEIPPTSRRISFDRVDEIVDELARRRVTDQRVRQPGAYDTPEGIAEMHRVDTDNTAWIRATITDVGWIDAARFGRQASSTAFLIVQHSGDLELMVTALPLIEADVKAGLSDGGGFALLHDRLALRLGGKQRYGSQLGSSRGDDTLYISPLEDRESVDELRATMGMQPLADYLKLFEGEVAFYDDVAAERARAAVAER